MIIRDPISYDDLFSEHDFLRLKEDGGKDCSKFSEKPKNLQVKNKKYTSTYYPCEVSTVRVPLLNIKRERSQEKVWTIV